jgi:hypothetical protein
MEGDEKEMAKLFNQLITTISGSGLDQNEVGAVLVKLTVLHGLNRVKHDEFFQQLEYAWNYEKFFLPDSDEIH